jgi:hypothetical protein
MGFDAEGLEFVHGVVTAAFVKFCDANIRPSMR